MTHFEETSPKERALIPNVMQPSPINNIKREKIEHKRVINALKMKKNININPLQGMNLLAQCTKYTRKYKIQ